MLKGNFSYNVKFFLLLFIDNFRSSGWLADGFAVTRMQQYHVGCYPAGLNRRYYEKQARLDAYCFDVN